MLRRMTPADVRGSWDWMREGLRETAQKTHTRYLPEDVLYRLWGGSAFAYAIDTGPHSSAGFAILTEEHDPDGLVLFVWALWGRHLAPHKTAIYADLEHIAREVKAIRIRMQSPRKGWEREAYFAPVATLYEHEVAKC